MPSWLCGARQKVKSREVLVATHCGTRCDEVGEVMGGGLLMGADSRRPQTERCDAIAIRCSGYV